MDKLTEAQYYSSSSHYSNLPRLISSNFWRSYHKSPDHYLNLGTEAVLWQSSCKCKSTARNLRQTRQTHNSIIQTKLTWQPSIPSKIKWPLSRVRLHKDSCNPQRGAWESFRFARDRHVCLPVWIQYGEAAAGIAGSVIAAFCLFWWVFGWLGEPWTGRLICWLPII